MTRLRRILLAAYVVGFVVTYGHSYVHATDDLPGVMGMGAALESIFWPLYWSVQLWRMV